MWKRIQRLAVAVAVIGATAGMALAAEGPNRRDPSGMPKGSFTASCACQISGGVTLMCFCSNMAAKMFETTLDVRACQAPKDIKNCDGKLTCTEGVAAACPGK